MMQLQDFMRMAGEDWEVTRNGKVIGTAEGIRQRTKDKVDFLPGTDIQVGDVVTGSVCKQTYTIVRTDVIVADGEVFSVEAFYSQGRRNTALPSVNTFNVGTMSHSVVQQGSPNAVATMQIQEGDKTSIAEVLSQVAGIIDSLALEMESKEELRDDIRAVEAEVKRTKPKESVVSTYLNAIKGKLVEAALKPLTEQASSTVAWAIEKLKSLVGGT